jgi:hypothetical protein
LGGEGRGEERLRRESDGSGRKNWGFG